MSDFAPASQKRPCPICGRPNPEHTSRYCGWTKAGWIKCQFETVAPPGWVRVTAKEGVALFRPDDGGGGKPPRKAGAASKRETPAKGKATTSYATADDAIAAIEGHRGKASDAWLYHNASGEMVGVVLRWNRKDGKKDILPLSIREGQWVCKAMPTPRPLYGLPELLAAEPDAPVYVVEGERCADAARSLGFLVVTSARGSGAAGESDWSPLRGHPVVIGPDHDAGGYEYAANVVRLARAAGAKRVRVIRLVELWPELPEGGDLVDFREHRGGDADAVRAEVEALAERTESEPPTVDTPTGPPTFDPDALFPEGAAYARDFVLALSQSTQTPIEMAGLLCMAGASGCLCNVARVRGHGDHIEPAPIWALSLNEPAVRKSAVISEVVSPIMAWEKRRAEELAPEIAAAAQRRKIEDRRLNNLGEQAAKETNAGKRSILVEQATALAKEIAADPIPTAPLLLASEPTPEALSRQMAANHGRALLASAEADALDIIQGRYSGSRNYGIFLKGHAGDPVRAQRVGRPGDSIDRPALALALCVQPQAVRELWSDENAAGRGLLARFCVIAPTDRIGSRDVRPSPVPDAVRGRWRRAIDTLLAVEPSDEPMMVTLSPDADSQFHDFQRRTEQALGSGDLADRRAWGGKLCGLALRIALTLHALETWAVAGRPGDFPQINGETMRAAIAWADYLAAAESHARAMLFEPAEARDRRELLRWIASKGGVTTARELQRGPRAYREPDLAEAALRKLVAMGLAVVELDTHGPEGGRPADRFRLVNATPSRGDGDTTGANTEPAGGSVAVAADAIPADDGPLWGELK